MANWAIVIGIDKYWDDASSLNGAVADAMKMSKWLAAPNGGAVPEYNLFYLLSPTPASASTIPAGTNYLPATRENIVDIIKQVLERSGPRRGEKLFYYYAGHGISVIADDSGSKTALIPSDFTPKDPGRSISIDSICRFLKGYEFLDQFFFIDACRNVPLADIRIGDFPYKIPSEAINVQQFIFYSTSAGLKAAEYRDPLNPRGAFTEVLLGGLMTGTGNSKAWEPGGGGEYVVTVGTLFEYVREEIVKRRDKASPSEKEEIQVPKVGGDRGAVRRTSNPVLVRFKKERFPKLKLEVFVDPREAFAKLSHVSIYRDGESKYQKNKAEVSNLPFPFELEPREYGVTVNSVNYDHDPSPINVKVYESIPLTIKLKEKFPPGLPPPKPVSPTYVSYASKDRWSDIAGRFANFVYRPFSWGKSFRKNTDWKEIPYQQIPHRNDIMYGIMNGLIVMTDDPEAPLELVDSKGSIVDMARGQLRIENLNPGFYTAKLKSPEGRATEKLVETTSGINDPIYLKAPKPFDLNTRFSFKKELEFNIDDNNMLYVSEGAGPIAVPELSTVVTLAARANLLGESYWAASNLRKINFESLQDSELNKKRVGIIVVLVDETKTDSEYYTKVRVRLWSHDSSPPERTHKLNIFPITSLGAEISIRSNTGPHWLRVQMPNERCLIFNTYVLPNRITLFVVHRDLENHPRIFQYFLAQDPTKDFDIKDEDITPNLVTRHLRSLEMTERFFYAGDLEKAYHIATESISKSLDPIKLCMAGYLSQRNRNKEVLNIVSNTLIKHFPTLSDSYLLRGEHYLLEEDIDSAKKEFQMSLDSGLPIFSRGLMRVGDLLTLYQLRLNNKHENDYLDNLIHFLLKDVPWTSWDSLIQL